MYSFIDVSGWNKRALRTCKERTVIVRDLGKSPLRHSERHLAFFRFVHFWDGFYKAIGMGRKLLSFCFFLCILPVLNLLQKAWVSVMPPTLTARAHDPQLHPHHHPTSFTSTRVNHQHRYTSARTARYYHHHFSPRHPHRTTSSSNTSTTQHCFYRNFCFLLLLCFLLKSSKIKITLWY